MFSFNPKSDEEINAIQNRHLLPDGIYPFIVKEIEEYISSKGNPMLKVRLGVLDNENGEERNILDYLLSTDQMIFKLKHFCEAIGLGKEYLAGKLDLEKCLNRSGECVINIQKGTAREDNTLYPDKNSVRDYIVNDLPQEKPVDKNDFINDDIKF